MTYRIAICDDEENAMISLHHQLKNLEVKYDINYEVSRFYNPKELLSSFTAPGMFHAIFLDIEMPNMNGLELAQYIRNNIDRRVQIIFVSNYPEYMQDSFPTRPFDYCTKPLQDTTLENIIMRLTAEFEESRVDLAIIHQDGTEEFINVHDIYYIESDKGNKNHLQFILENHTIPCLGNFSDWELYLSDHHFISPHRGILVNIEHIHFIDNGFITLTNQKKLPISRRQEQQIKPIFARHIYSINRD